MDPDGGSLHPRAGDFVVSDLPILDSAIPLLDEVTLGCKEPHYFLKSTISVLGLG